MWNQKRPSKGAILPTCVISGSEPRATTKTTDRQDRRNILIGWLRGGIVAMLSLLILRSIARPAPDNGVETGLPGENGQVLESSTPCGHCPWAKSCSRRTDACKLEQVGTRDIGAKQTAGLRNANHRLP